MRWSNSNDDLTRQSQARRERENREFENGLGHEEDFMSMRSRPFGDRLRGSQGDPFANGVGRQIPPFNNPQQQVPPQSPNQHQDWTGKVASAAGKSLMNIWGYTKPVLWETDDMFRSDYRLRRGLTAFIQFYGLVFGLSFVFGIFTKFATFPVVAMSGICLASSGGYYAYKNSKNPEWGLEDDSAWSDPVIEQEEAQYDAYRREQEEFGDRSSHRPSFEDFEEPQSAEDRPPFQEEVPQFKNMSSTGGWGDLEDDVEEDPFNSQPKNPLFQKEEVDDLVDPFGSSPVDRAKDVWGDAIAASGIATATSVEVSELFEEDEGEEEENTSRAELENPQDEKASEGAFSTDLAGGIEEPELVSRKLLVDKYLSVLDGSSLKPDWSRDVPKDSLEFQQLETFLRDAQTGGLKGLSEMDWVQVQSITERVSVFEIVTDRPEKMKGKESSFAKEITELLRDQMKNFFGESVYTTAVGRGSRIFITIFKQTAVAFMLRELVSAKRDYFENPKNELPVVFGADEFGEPIVLDLAKHTGTIIAGLARTGKSVLATSIVNQMIALNSPKKVQFVIGDMKNKDSDWYQITAPHIKKFVSGAPAILNLLDWVVSTEAPRRKRQLGNELKIQDYNAKCSSESEKMPYLFVVLDEIISFAGKLTKEDKIVYKSYLSEILTAFPNLGIFLIFVPHQLHDDYFPKTASRMVENRFAVKAGVDIQKTIWTDTYRSIDFPTTKQGDFAYTLASSSEPKFGHAPLIMSLNEGKERLVKLYESQRRMWTKLYPEEAANSAYVQRLKNEGAQETLDKLGINSSANDFYREDNKKQDLGNYFVRDI